MKKETLIFTAKKNSHTSYNNDEDFLPVCFSYEELKKAIALSHFSDVGYSNSDYTEGIFKICKPYYAIYQAYFSDYDSGNCIFERAFI